MNDEFQGRVALITAAAGFGVGQAVARRLAAGGAAVVITDSHARRTAAITEAVAAAHPAATVVGYPMDVGDRDRMEAVVGEVTQAIGPVQILVNNAAVNVLGSIFDYDPGDWDRVLEVTLSGAWYLCRLTMPSMREAGGGVIVNISSYSPDVGGLGLETPYAVAKGGLNTLTRACAHEGGPFNIRAVTVATGLLKGTKFADDHPELFQMSAGPLPIWPEPADVAEAVAFLASSRARCITGEVLNVASGAYMRV